MTMLMRLRWKQFQHEEHSALFPLRIRLFSHQRLSSSGPSVTRGNTEKQTINGDTVFQLCSLFLFQSTTSSHVHFLQVWVEIDSFSAPSSLQPVNVWPPFSFNDIYSSLRLSLSVCVSSQKEVFESCPLSVNGKIYFRDYAPFLLFPAV